VRSPLDQIWLRAGLRDHVIGYDETRQWPKDKRERIFALGILRRREDAEAVQCDACGEPHTEEVIYPGDDGADGLISCPRLGVVRVPRERRQQWEVVAAGLNERAGFGVEISPAYCDVILRRLQESLKLTPVHAVTGEPFQSNP